mgnify:CR=1 FL=1
MPSTPQSRLNAPTGARRFLPQRFRARADVWYVLMHLQVRGASCLLARTGEEASFDVLMHLQVRGASCPMGRRSRP